MNMLAAAPNIAARPILPELIVEIPPHRLNPAMLNDVTGWDARAELTRSPEMPPLRG
jgi:hypothetical protein